MNKYNRVTKLFKRLLFTVGLAASCSAIAQEQANACRDVSTSVIFYNGVFTTEAGAKSAAMAMRHFIGGVSKSGEGLRYEVMYNHTNGLEDLVETFAQRSLEHGEVLQDRYELFLESISGGGAWTEAIVGAVPSALSVLDGIIDSIRAAEVSVLTSLVGDPPTLANYEEHQLRIDDLLQEGRKLVYVAHSQGNLFVNAAYDYTVSKSSPDNVKVVHVAPASPTLNGEYTLADLDVVINGLRALGEVPSNTDSIPIFLQREAGLNGRKDTLGHGFIEIYLNPYLSTFDRVVSHIESAISTVIAPAAQVSGGFFTTTLTWDGSGDVDLHVTEPDGTHVFFAIKQGVTGYLDADNTSGYGPEHYYASCNVSTLQTGVYEISLANYYAADGRTATVQVSAWSQGALSTKKVVLGAHTFSEPAYNVFNIEVCKNAANNYVVRDVSSSDGSLCEVAP